jgi:hypothetical protein
MNGRCFAWNAVRKDKETGTFENVESGNREIGKLGN